MNIYIYYIYTIYTIYTIYILYIYIFYSYLCMYAYIYIYIYIYMYIYIMLAYIVRRDMDNETDGQVRQVDIARLEAFEMWIWRRMERISWTEHISNEEVLTL